MKPAPALPWTLALLDDGLRLYRRHVLGFILVGSAIQIPLAIVGLLVTAIVNTQLGQDWEALGVLIRSVLQYPLLLLTYVALSRAAGMALDNQPIKIGQTLRIPVSRYIGMGCYNVLFTIIFGIVAMVMVVSVICPLIYTSIFGAGLLGRFGGSGTMGAAGAVVLVLSILTSIWIIVLAGATMASQVYAVQAFALERQTFSATLTRSIDILTYRFGRNLLVFLGAGAISSTLVASYTGTLLAGGAFLLQFLDIELSLTATQTLQILLTTFTGVLLLPPLPIWMAMLHRKVSTERDGADLVTEVQHWKATVAPEGQA